MRSSTFGSCRESHRCFALVIVESDFFGFGFESVFDLLVLQLLQFKQHVAAIATHDFFLHAEFFRCLLHEHGTLPSGVQVDVSM